MKKVKIKVVFFSPYQNGKIDGVFPTSNEGLIHKVSDGNLNGIAGTLQNFFIDPVNVMIIQTNKNDIFSFISDLGSLALNRLADLKKRMSDKDKDLSGYYKLGELWKDLVPSAPSQDILKKNCESKKNFFGIEEKVPTFISSDEVKRLFKTEQEIK